MKGRRLLIPVAPSYDEKEEPHRSHDFKKGYKDAMTHGPSKYPQGESPLRIMGYEAGLHHLHELLPREVHAQLQMIHWALFLYGQGQYHASVTTPELSSASRRAVHVLLKGAGDAIKVSTLGHKQSATRRMRIVVDSLVLWPHRDPWTHRD